MAYSPRDKVVLITGAARGIGADAAQRLARKGAKVSLVGLEPGELARVAESCGPEAAWFECDVRDWDAVERAVAGTVERFGGIDVVVANAGIATVGTARSFDIAAWERTIDINLLGVWRTVRACLPHVIERRGYILPVASLAALVQGPGFSAYCATKAGVEAFGNSLRMEVAHLGVDVGVAYFSWIDTEMVKGGYEHPAYTKAREQQKGPFAKTYPVSDAGGAVVRGIEGRSKRVVAPWWLKLLLPIRGLLAFIYERDMREVAPDVVDLIEAEARERGAAEAALVGAGGQAAVREAEGASAGGGAPERAPSPS
jgi:NAD(P)-dependent dehydrogenase (short-subunit alcohol dehydrogenase family)